MTYKRPEDQYKIPRAREMVEELQKLNKKSPCTFTTVHVYRHLHFEGIEHAGVLTHRCSLEKDHKEKCTCLCGVEWQGWS